MYIYSYTLMHAFGCIYGTDISTRLCLYTIFNSLSVTGSFFSVKKRRLRSHREYSRTQRKLPRILYKIDGPIRIHRQEYTFQFAVQHT